MTLVENKHLKCLLVSLITKASTSIQTVNKMTFLLGGSWYLSNSVRLNPDTFCVPGTELTQKENHFRAILRRQLDEGFGFVPLVVALQDGRHVLQHRLFSRGFWPLKTATNWMKLSSIIST